MTLAFSSGCAEGQQSCWRPVSVPDGFPFVPLEVAAVWAALFLLALAMVVRRLGRE